MSMKTMSAAALMKMLRRKSLPTETYNQRGTLKRSRLPVMTSSGCWHPHNKNDGRLSFYGFVRWPIPDSEGRTGDQGE